MIQRPMFALLAALALAGPAAAEDGAAVFQSQCALCHSVEKPAHNRIGPSLLGVVGRKAGTAPGFAYSSAMAAYGQVWTPAALDAFLTAPRKAVPNTNMSFIGMKDPAKRAALIAFLQKQR